MEPSSVQVWDQRAQEIIGLLRRSVVDAIEIGRILTEVKQEMVHGTFLRWIAEKLPFSQKTAWNYMALYSYRDRLVTLTNLDSAYERVRELRLLESENKPKPKTPPAEPTSKKPDDGI